jgi:hypothetical protein
MLTALGRALYTIFLPANSPTARFSTAHSCLLHALLGSVR